MTLFDYSKEPKSDIAFIDMRSFYSSVECVERTKLFYNFSMCDE